MTNRLFEHVPVARCVQRYVRRMYAPEAAQYKGNGSKKRAYIRQATAMLKMRMLSKTENVQRKRILGLPKAL